MPTTSTNAVPAEMTAVLQLGYGDPSQFQLSTVATPSVGPKDVLIEVHAAAIDRGTEHLLSGRPLLLRLGFGLRRPRAKVPGLDLAGVVVGVGTSVTTYCVGDSVFGVGKGSLSPYAIARPSKLVRKPDELGFAEAAALAVSGLTAMQAIVDAGQLQEGQRVLILGASGGVGSYAVQLAHSLGGHVTAVCSGTKAEFVQRLGANEVVDYKTGDVLVRLELVAPFDLIIDFGGNHKVRHLRKLLTERGALVIGGGEDGGGALTGGFGRGMRAAIRSPFVRHRLVMLASRVTTKDLERLSAYVASGAVVPSIDRTFALVEAGDAMRHLASGSVRGKVVIAVRS
jgi:NADPH:quinone reductase-like Zn-dependent oxidoreductase